MARNLAPVFFASLQQEVTTTCHCWQITRRDGGVIGFTTLDQDLVIDGVTYQAAAGFERSALSTKKELEPGNLQLDSFFSESGISEADFLLGQYDGATVRVFLVDWLNLPDNLSDSGPMRFVPLLSGQLGEISNDGRTYQAQGRDLADRFNAQVGRVTSPTCPYTLGDDQCQAAIGPFTHAGTIAAVINPNTINLSSGIPATADYLAGGWIDILSGPNAGTRLDVASYAANRQAILWESPALPLQAGVAVSCVKGCAKTLAACGSFNNTVRFGGEHGGGNYTPGNDRLATGGV